MSTTFDDLRDMDEAPKTGFAGLLTRLTNRFRRKTPAAGSPENFNTDDGARTRMNNDNDRVEPTLEKDATEALFAQLLNSVASIWQQNSINADASARIKHLKDGGESNLEGTVMLVNEEQVAIYLGINPENGDHQVMSVAGISPRTALDHVLTALTCDVMRAEGIDDVNGTELDQALLCLAAEKNGLKINNMPQLSDEVKAQAAKLWAEAFPETPQAQAPAPEQKATLVENTEILPADRTAQPAENKASPDITDIDFKEIETADAPAAAVPLLTYPHSDTVIALGYVDYSAEESTPAALPADNIPVLTYEEPEEILRLAAPVPLAPKSLEIKPAALALLTAKTAEDTVNPVTFTRFVEDLKAGKFSDQDGMLDQQAIYDSFSRDVRGTTEADILLKAAEAQGVVYNATKTAPALRMVVNPHVSSPVKFDPERKAVTLAATAPVAATVDADSILAKAGIRRETYDEVKAFVASREGDIVRARDLVSEFAAVGVGAGKAQHLLAALQADGVTEPEENVHRIVARAPQGPAL